MASWSPGGTLDWWVRGGHHSSPKTREPEPCGSGSLLRRRHLQRVVKGSPSNAFGPPAANERHGRWLTLTPNLSGTGLRHEYPRVRYGNQPRGPAVAADAEDHLYAGAEATIRPRPVPQSRSAAPRAGCTVVVSFAACGTTGGWWESLRSRAPGMWCYTEVVETPAFEVVLPANNIFGALEETQGRSVAHGWVALLNR